MYTYITHAYPHTHAHMHTHAHTTHTCTHMHTPHTHAHMHIHAHTHTHAHTYTDAHTRTNPYMHTHALHHTARGEPILCSTFYAMLHCSSNDAYEIVKLCSKMCLTDTGLFLWRMQMVDQRWTDWTS